MHNFNLYGPLNDLGYGTFTRGLIRGLIDLGETSFHLNPIGPTQLENPQELNILKPQLNNSWNRNNTSIAIWHEFDLSKFSGNKLVAFPIFETTEFYPIGKHFLSQMDAVFVASSWAKNVVINNIGNSIPVHVVPAGANLIDNDEIKNTKKFTAFTFLTVGKYEQRKSPIEIIKAYLMGFAHRQEPTRLVCHCYNPFDQNFAKNISGVLGQLGLKIVKATTNACIVAVYGNCIVEIPIGRLPQQQVSQLYKACHVGVFPAKAEGWNLPLMESIQSGLPCIATNYSAHTEYLTEEFGYNQNLLLKNLVMQPANDGVFFHGDRGNWANFSIQDLSDKMVYSFEHYKEITESFDNTKIKETFTWRNMASKFIKALDEV